MIETFCNILVGMPLKKPISIKFTLSNKSHRKKETLCKKILEDCNFVARQEISRPPHTLSIKTKVFSKAVVPKSNARESFQRIVYEVINR